jgi:hypothetical protein
MSNGFAPIKPGGTGSQSETGGSQATGGSTPTDVGGVIDPCGNTIDIPGSVGETECVVSEVPLPDFDSIVKDPADGTMYSTFANEPAYETDFHTIQFPVTSDTVTDASFAVVANSTMKRRVTWMAERIGDWPLLPNPVTNNSNEVLLKTTISGKNIELIGDQQTKIYTISGEYIYGMVNPQNEVLYMGVPPYIDDSVTDTAIPSTSFVSGITSP